MKTSRKKTKKDLKALWELLSSVFEIKKLQKLTKRLCDKLTTLIAFCLPSILPVIKKAKPLSSINQHYQNIPINRQFNHQWEQWQNPKTTSIFHSAWVYLSLRSILRFKRHVEQLKQFQQSRTIPKFELIIPSRHCYIILR